MLHTLLNNQCVHLESISIELGNWWSGRDIWISVVRPRFFPSLFGSDTPYSVFVLRESTPYTSVVCIHE